MQVLIAADIFPPDSGGPATYSLNLARGFSSVGIKTKIVSLNPQGENISDITYHISKKNKLLKYIEYIWLVFKHSKQADLIYAMGPVNAGLPAWFVAKLRGKELVVKVVGDYAWEQGVQRFGTIQDIDTFQNKKIRHSLPVYILRWIQSFVVKHARCTIVPSQYLKKIVVGWGAEKENVEVVYNAVKFKKVEAMKKPEGERWLVSVGRLVPWKGMDTLIKIMPDLLPSYPNLKLKIIGDGPEYNNLESRILNLELGNAVHMLGRLPNKETLSYIKSADIFVLNSAYEGLSHVLLEALRFKKPIAASDCGGNSELVQKGVGELFKYNDTGDIENKIRKILENPRIYTENQTSDEWLGFFKQFDYQYMLDKTVKALESVCQH